MSNVTNTTIAAVPPAAVPAAAPAPPGHFRVSYEGSAEDRANLTHDELAVINIDVQLAVTTAFTALPFLEGSRETIRESLPKIDIERLDKLKARAEALFYANAHYLTAGPPSEPLPVLGARGGEIRDLLGSDIGALVKRNLLDAASVAELKGGPGYLNTATDILMQAQVLRARWPQIASRCAIQLADLDEAESLAERITAAVADRALQVTTSESATEERQRAFTLMLQSYDLARRVATFLRWEEGDLEKVVPSLYAGRSTRAASANVGDAPGDGATPPAKADGPVQPKQGAAEGPAAPPGHAAGGPAAPVPVGMPGSSPFTS